MLKASSSQGLPTFCDCGKKHTCVHTSRAGSTWSFLQIFLLLLRQSKYRVHVIPGKPRGEFPDAQLWVQVSVVLRNSAQPLNSHPYLRNRINPESSSSCPSHKTAPAPCFGVLPICFLFFSSTLFSLERAGPLIAAQCVPVWFCIPVV